MNKNLLLLAFILLPFIASVSSKAEDAAAPTAETRLRQALRDTMVQLRDAQNQAVTLQAAQAQSDKDKADLQAKVDDLTAQLKSMTEKSIADRDASDKAIADLKSQVTDLTGQAARLTDGLKQWKDAYNQVAQLAAEKEAARSQYAMQAAVLQRTVDDRETKNLALYKLGIDILKRYEQFGLGDAISAKEPFVGGSRVKLENLVQDYKNKILDQAVTSGQPLPPQPITPKAEDGTKPEPLPAVKADKSDSPATASR
jgi:DNA repair exonuclease SbcCD ATPase subunit